ncbi:DUF5677 domain-containing protein [Longispora sp. K20-0274]|uniref:DUF5677 domain-containing protein n=1 Tax=Longispora sp. K20-0274 TaxID=3088255 RepID=UPI00399B017A
MTHREDLQPATADEDHSAQSWSADGHLLPIMVEAAQEAMTRGFSEAEAVEMATQAIVEVIPKFVGPVTASLHHGKAGLLRWLADGRGKLRAEVEASWGPALATYEACTYLAYELGSKVHQSYQKQTGEPDDITSEVAFLLHGRTCLVAGEVLCLMRDGFGDGAAGRKRTLHELVVVMSVIMTHADKDLAQRYVDYAVVEQHADMKHYQEHAEALGQRPFDQAAIDELEAEYQTVLQKYGPLFHRPNQWAAPLFPGRDKSIQFTMLEEAAELKHHRPLYRESNHYVHAGPRAAVLNTYVQRGGWTIGVGARAERDLAEVGHGALVSLLQCTASLIAHVPVATENPDNLLGLMCLQQLVEDAGLAFWRGSGRMPSSL